MQSLLQQRGDGRTVPGAPKTKLLDLVGHAIRARHYSKRTERSYVDWIKRFIVFHGKRHPLEMGEAEINQFLTGLASQQESQRFHTESSLAIAT